MSIADEVHGAASAPDQGGRPARGKVRIWVGGAVLLLAAGATCLVVANNLTERTPRAEFPAGDVIYLSRDCGRLLVAQGAEATLYDTHTGKQLASYEGAAAYTAAGFSRDGGTLALGLATGDTELWDLKTGKSRARFRAHDVRVQMLRFQADGSLVVGVRQPRKRYLPPYHWAFVEAVRWWKADGLGPLLAKPGRLSPNGRVLVEIAKEGLNVWDTASARLRCTLPVTGQNYDMLAISWDGTTLATQAPLRAWDTVTGKERAALQDPPVGTGSLLVSPDGRLLLRREGLWEVRTGRKLRGRWNSFDPYLYTADGRWVVAVGWQRGFSRAGYSTHCLVDPDTGVEQARVAHGARPSSSRLGSFLALSTDSGTLVTAHWRDGWRGSPAVAVRVWDWEPYWRGNPAVTDLREVGWLCLVGAAVLGLVALVRARPPVWVHVCFLFVSPLAGFVGGIAALVQLHRAIFGDGPVDGVATPLLIPCFFVFPFLGLFLALALVRLCPARCGRCGGRAYIVSNRPVTYRCTDCGHVQVTAVQVRGGGRVGQ
jgi:hypothetical protein